MKEILKQIWQDIKTPSTRDESAYETFLIGCGHLLLGSCFAFMFTSWLFIIIPIGYWLIKEWRDLRNGGDIIDGLMDAGFVGIGAASGIPFIIPAGIIVLVGMVTLAFVYYKQSKKFI